MKHSHRRKVRRHHKRKHESLRTAAGFVCLGVVISALIYAGNAGSTEWWPEARSCSVVGSRVVVAGVTGDSVKDPVVIYRGEYHIRYVAKGKAYFLWAESEFIDSDKMYVEERLKDLSIDCPVRVQYNPHNPAESVTHLLPR